MNKLLQRQLQKHFGGADQVPGNFIKLLNVISESYDHYEKDRKMIERSIELSSKEMIELNSQVKKEKEELKKAHKELKTLFEDINEILYSVNMVSNKLIQISAVCEKVYGYTPAEFLSDNDLWHKVIYPEDKHISEQQVQTLQQGKQVLNEYRIIHKDGSIRWIENKIIPTLDITGRLIRINGVTSDITERKNNEKALRESEKRLRQIIDLVPHFIFAKDAKGKFMLANEAVARAYGSTVEDLIGKSDADFNAEKEEVEHFMQEDLEVINSGNAKYNIEETITDAAGNIRILSTTKIPYTSLGVDIPGVLGVSVDISERKKAETVLKESEGQLSVATADLEIKNKQLEQKNKELEQFAYVASHDMQEPLRTTSSFVEMLQQQYQGKLDAKADKYLTFIAQSSDRMKVLIKDLLDYSRIGRKKELAEVDCNIMLNEVLADLGTAINETGAKIKTDQLPVVSGYPTEIKQLFQNLIINAIKFRKKTIAPQINISAQKTSGYWQFAFKDNGIGIEEKHNERIFIIFQRLHSRNKYEGSGIGLSHCKKIAELHQGRIWLKSELGRGATFYFTIPQKNNN